MAPPATARKKIDAAGIDWVLEQLEDGRSYRTIAKELGVGTMSLHAALHDNPVHSVRARDALAAGADAYEELAVSILDDAQQQIRDEPQLANSIVTLARERSQACWRMASVRDPRRFSDKRASTLDVTVTHTAQLSTADLERIASQALTLLPDGTVEGGRSDIGEAGE